MIVAQGLAKFYGSVPAIQDVSFRVEQGEVVGFLGPNGAGKSTTIRILTCYMPPTAGMVSVDGLDCFEESLEVRQRIGYLPEHVALYRNMTVMRMLHFAAGAKGVEPRQRKAECQRVIDICGLDQVSHRIIGHLSKGYRQRVGLAQALLGNPPVLILDEPTIGLDPKQIREIRSVIKGLRGRHTILLSSHVLPEVAQICSRVLIINKGRILATDSPANLTSQLQEAAHVSLRVGSHARELALSLEQLDGVQRVTAAPDGRNRLTVETDRSRDLRPDIARLVVERGVDLLELRRIDLSLEDIFLQLVTEETDRVPGDEGAKPAAPEAERNSAVEIVSVRPAPRK